MLYVFDCDGVLVDSENIVASVESEIFAKYGFEITPEQINIRFAGLAARATADIVESELGHKLPDDFFEQCRDEIDQRLARDLRAMPGAEAMLDRLDGQPFCVCSNSSARRLRLSLEKVRLWERFQPHVYSAVEVGDLQPKPAPNVYRYAMAQFDADPRDSVVLEDTVSGVRAAKAAGARVIGFTGGTHTWPGHADLLTDAGAETVINRLADLPATAAALLAWEGLPD